MRNNPKPQEIYQHFKGNLYRIVTMAEHSETGEMMVVYQALYGEFLTYVRPLASFMEKRDREKYPDAAQKYRFQLQNDLIESKAAEAMAAEAGAAELRSAGSIDSADFQPEEMEQENNIDPLLMEFLGARTVAERLRILSGLHHRITDDMINTMSVSIDLEIKEGDLEERYMELKNCLLTMKRFERVR